MGPESAKSGYILEHCRSSQPKTRNRGCGHELYLSIRPVRVHSKLFMIRRLPLIEGVGPDPRLLQPEDSRSRPKLTIRKLGFPAPVELASISMSANAYDDSTICMAFHPQVARLAVAERKRIVIRTARSER